MDQRYWNVTGLVLKHYTSGEKDRRVIFLIKNVGKVAAKARGAKILKSPFNSRLSPINLCQLLLYKTPQNTWTVTQCQTLNVFEQVKNDLDKASIALSIVDILQKCTEDQHANDALLDLAITTLEKLEQAKEKTENKLIFQSFQMKTLDILGVLPSFSSCARCHRKISLETMEGWHPLEILCGNCHQKTNQIAYTLFENNYLKLLNYIRQNSFEQILKIRLQPPEYKNLNQILRLLWAAQAFSLPKSIDVLESLHA